MAILETLGFKILLVTIAVAIGAGVFKFHPIVGIISLLAFGEILAFLGVSQSLIMKKNSRKKSLLSKALLTFIIVTTTMGIAEAAPNITAPTNNQNLTIDITYNVTVNGNDYISLTWWYGTDNVTFTNLTLRHNSTQQWLANSSGQWLGILGTADLPEGTYYIKVGGNGTINSTAQTIGYNRRYFYFQVNSTHANFNFTVGNWSQNFTLSTSVSAYYNNGTGVGVDGGIPGVNLTYYLPYGVNPAAPSNCNSSLLYNINLTNGTVCGVNLGTVGPGAASHTLLVNLSVGAFPKYWPNALNITINASNGNVSAANVSGSQITSTGGIGRVTRDHYALNFWVNPRPGIKDYYQNYDNSNSSVIFTYWNQTDPEYKVMTPLMTYNSTTNRTQLSNGTYADVLYFGGREMIERPNWMRLWGYNMTFKLIFNGSGTASYWIYTPVNNTVFPEQTLFPIYLSTRNVTSPMENVTFSMTIGVPDQNTFSIWYNGTQYNTTTLTQTENVNISFVPANQNQYAIQVNASNSTANNTQISILFTMMNFTTDGAGNPVGQPSPVSPIYVDFQNITGFQPTSPPKLGENITTTYLINVSNKLRNYTLDYLRLHFFMPINVTINDVGANTNTTYRLTQGANLSWKVYNGDDVWHDAGITSANKSFQVNDSMPGSPSKDDNITIWFTSYDITLASAYFNSWLPGPNSGIRSNSSMNFTSVMSFPPLNETTPPTVTTGGDYQYNVSVSMSMQAGLNLTAKVPGLNASASNIRVLVDGSALTNGTNYTVGSLNIDSLGSGTHSVSLSYSVASGAAVSSAAAAEAAAGAPAPEVVSKVDITPTKTADIITSFGYQNREVYIAPAHLFGVLGALDAFPTKLEEKKSVESILFSGVKTLEGDVYTLAKERVLAKYSKSDSVIIARGDLGLDALASTAYARALGVPILLVEPQKAPQVTLDALTMLGTKSVTIVGGPVAVSEDVRAKLPSPTRIGSANRHETAVKIAEALMTKISVNSIVITDSNNPDPKAVLMAAYYRAPIVYVEGDKVPAATETFIKGNKDKFTKAVRYAGISATAKEKVEKLL